MGVRRLAAVAAASQLVLLAICSSASASGACPTDTIRPATDNGYDAAMAVVCDVNVMRTEHGLPPLHWDWRLWSGAQMLAADMAARHYAAHFTPEGVGMEGRMEPTGYIPQTGTDWQLAENLGWGTDVLSTPLAIVLGWM